MAAVLPPPLSDTPNPKLSPAAPSLAVRLCCWLQVVPPG